MKRIALILAASLVLFGCSDGNRDAVTFAVTEKDVADQVQQKLPQDDASGTEEDEDDEDEVITPSVPVNPGTGGGSSDGGNTGGGTPGSGDDSSSGGTGDGNTPGTSGGSGSSGQTGGQASGNITDNDDGTCTYNIQSSSTGTITIPTKVDGKVVTKVTFSTNTTRIGIEAFIVADDNEKFCTVDGVLFSKDKKTLVFCPGVKADSYTIPKEVETIGDGAFRGCEKLTSINIESGSNLKTIGVWAFGNLSNVTIDLSNVTDIKTIGGSAFNQDNKTGVKVIVANEDMKTKVSSHGKNIDVEVKGSPAP